MLLQELAALVEVSATSASQWENDKKEPSDENLAKVAKVLDFPVAFFFGEPLPSLDAGRFRSLARMTARQRNTALAAGSQCIAIDGWISEHFDRPHPSLPDLRDLSPVAAAQTLRSKWGLGSRPLPNLIHLLELHGVRVYSLVHDGTEVDAFSLWQDSTPFIFLNTRMNPERSRMNVAHELGHLLLHGHAAPTEGKEEEREANEFASAFLLPEGAVLASVPRPFTLDAIFAAKKHWGVSAMAYIYRLHSLGRLPDRVYRGLCIRLRAGGAREEPSASLAPEQSQVLAKVLGSNRKGGSARVAMSRDLNIATRDVDDATFGLALTAVSGGERSEPSVTRDLRLVR